MVKLITCTPSKVSLLSFVVVVVVVVVVVCLFVCLFVFYHLIFSFGF